MNHPAHDKLLPCPFCGDDGDKGVQEVTMMTDERPKFNRITCRACGAMCPEHNWNRRIAPGQLEVAERDWKAEAERAQGECDAIAELDHAKFLALENVRLLASRHRNEDWAGHMLRFCAEAGNAARTLRTPTHAAAADKEGGNG